MRMISGKGSIIMKKAQLFAIIILAALVMRCDDMGHDALRSLGGFRYMIRNESTWSMRLGGTGTDYGYAITTDRSGSVIVAGRVNGDADLDGSGVIADALPEDPDAIPGCYGGVDAFISKFDRSGTFQWAKRLGGTGTDSASDVASDIEDNLVVVGWANGDSDFTGDGDKSTEPEKVSTAHEFGQSDVFISKFDFSGNPVWALRLGGDQYDYAQSVTIDNDDRVIATGAVRGNAHLNSDEDTFDDGENGAGYGEEDIFITAFTSSGEYCWSKRLGGGGEDYGLSLTHDSVNNVIVTGYVDGNADLNGDGVISPGLPETSPGNPYGDKDIFISKFNSSGTHLWSRRLGGTTEDYCYSVESGGDDSLFITGYIQGNADLNGDGDALDGGAEDSTGYGDKDVFITGFNADGTHLWSRRLGGAGNDNDNGCGLAVSGGAVFVTGNINGNADLNGDGDADDGGAEDEGIYGAGDVFIAAFKLNGEALWSKRLGSGTNDDSGRAIAVNGSGDIILAGDSWGNADLNGDGDFIDEYEEITAGTHDGNDVFFTVFPENYFFFFP